MIIKKRAERGNVRHKTIQTDRIISCLCEKYKLIINTIAIFINFNYVAIKKAGV